MKMMFLCIVMLCVFPLAKLKAQDDTTGFWQVQRNGKEISPVTINSEKNYFINSPDDTGDVNIFYYTESPCKKCPCKLEIRDGNGNVLITIERKGYGDNRPFPLPAGDIKTWLAKGKAYMYFSGKYDGWMPWIYMGVLSLIKK